VIRPISLRQCLPDGSRQRDCGTYDTVAYRLGIHPSGGNVCAITSGIDAGGHALYIGLALAEADIVLQCAAAKIGLA
jgi:hypothetical protein